MAIQEPVRDLAFADHADRFAAWERREAARAESARDAPEATRDALTPVVGAPVAVTDARARGALDDVALTAAVWRAVVTAFCAGWGAGLAAAERDAGGERPAPGVALRKGANMSHTVLVPLDGSPLAERALPFAEALARPGGGRVVLVRAVPYLSRPASDAPFPTLAAAQDAAAREALDYLDAVAARLAGRGVAVDVATPRADETAAILGEAERRGAGLIAMATHGRGGLRRLVYGSIAEEVLARATIPTLVVRAWVPTGGAARLADHPRLLVPLDGSADAAAALPVAEALADELGGTLVLMRAVARPDLAFAPDILAGPLLRQELAEERAAAEDYLRVRADVYARAGRAVETVVRVGRPGLEMAAAVIEDVGRERDAALVVMASHRYAGLNRLILGSVADATLRHGTLPVVLVRPVRAPAVPEEGPA